MARYLNTLEVKKPAAEVNKLIQDFMNVEGFKLTNYQNETVWKKGVGLLTAPQFMKTTVTDGKVEIQAWIKFALLPGVFVGEMGITGFFGFAIKAVLKGRVQKLQTLLTT